MSRTDVIRAWKDRQFRDGMSAAARQAVPANPVGPVELTPAEAATVDGQLSVAICSSCHGCTKVSASYLTRINPSPLLRF